MKASIRRTDGRTRAASDEGFDPARRGAGPFRARPPPGTSLCGGYACCRNRSRRFRHPHVRSRNGPTPRRAYRWWGMLCAQLRTKPAISAKERMSTEARYPRERMIPFTTASPSGLAKRLPHKGPCAAWMRRQSLQGRTCRGPRCGDRLARPATRHDADLSQLVSSTAIRSAAPCAAASLRRAPRPSWRRRAAAAGSPSSRAGSGPSRRPSAACARRRPAGSPR